VDRSQDQPGVVRPGPGHASTTLRLERHEAICWLILDRPGKGNALNPHVLDEIDHSLQDLAADRSVKVLIIRGNGRGFCSGHELGRDRGTGDALSVLERMNRSFGTFERIWSFPKPVIAAVHGYCFGAATQLATSCDLVAVSSDVQIGLPRLPMGAGLTPPMLALAVGIRRAKQLAFDIGSTMDAPTAVAWGWANFSSAPDRLIPDVTALAERIARSPLEVLAGQKAVLNRVAAQSGFWQAATAGIEMDAMHHFAGTGAPTASAIREHGVKGALDLFERGLLGGG
jgi:enoyl-CoA hydratase